MPIVEVLVENYKKVREIHDRPKIGVNEYTGENGAGKTSYLDAIATMGGMREIAWKPIRDGAEEAMIQIDIAGIGPTDIRMIRKFRRGEDGKIIHSLSVEGPGGARFPKPQSVLDALMTEFSFDPLKFIEAPAKEQFDVMRSFVSGVDFDDIDRQNQEDFDVRRDINRRAKELRAQAASFVAEDGPTEEVDESALVAELEEAGRVNARIQEAKSRKDHLSHERDRHLNDAQMATTRIAALRKEIEQLKESAAASEKAAHDIETELASMGGSQEPVETADIRQRIEAARQHNEKARRRREAAEAHQRAVSEAEALERRSAELTKAMEDRNEQKRKAIAESKLPIDGLGFEDGRVMFNGQPLDQASRAEQIRVSVAIATALNPKLKVAFVKDGSLLDKKSWALLEQFATEYGLQVFVETVDSSRPTAVVIEDGSIKASGDRAGASMMDAAE